MKKSNKIYITIYFIVYIIIMTFLGYKIYEHKNIIITYNKEFQKTNKKSDDMYNQKNTLYNSLNEYITDNKNLDLKINELQKNLDNVTQKLNDME